MNVNKNYFLPELGGILHFTWQPSYWEHAPNSAFPPVWPWLVILEAARNSPSERFSRDFLVVYRLRICHLKQGMWVDPGGGTKILHVPECNQKLK